MLLFIWYSCEILQNPMITCVDGNIRSERAILANSGVFEYTIHEPDENKDLKRFWITLRWRYNMIKWIFFDVGSTLVDETKAYDHRVREMIAGTSITFKEFDEVRIALAKQGLDGNSAAIKHFGLKTPPWHSEDEVPYSDAHTTLAALIDKGYKLGIIANQKFGTAERLETWGLRQYLDVIATSAELGYSKPDREIFEKAFEIAGCVAAESVMVGDRLDNDIIPAKTIGMKTVWVKNGLAQYQSEELGDSVADYQIGSLSELLVITELLMPP